VEEGRAGFRKEEEEGGEGGAAACSWRVVQEEQGEGLDFDNKVSDDEGDEGNAGSADEEVGASGGSAVYVSCGLLWLARVVLVCGRPCV